MGHCEREGRDKTTKDHLKEENVTVEDDETTVGGAAEETGGDEGGHLAALLIRSTEEGRHRNESIFICTI
ncbi:hypothetical protein SESBI_21163 [Sesbania bispinosa]|nr:hypothetical protein SESBI_21163 [Sesbania bispinosa]